MDTSLFLIVLTLLSFGLIMVFSASFAFALQYRKDSLFYIKRQTLFAGVGLALMLLTSRIHYKLYKKFAVPLFVLGIGLMIAALFFVTNGVRRWIPLGPFSFQPSEFMKFALIVLFATLIAKNSEKMKTFKYGVMPFGLLLLLVCLLTMLQRHLSATLIIAFIAFVMMFVGGTPVRYFLAMIPMGLAGIAGIIVLQGSTYMTDRLSNWLDPFSQENILSDVWQTTQSLIAIGSGGIMGVGLGASRQKYLYLPEPQNDFIFAIIAEELGLLGAALVIVLFVLFIYRGFAIANKAPDKFAALLAIGITVQIGIQAILNIAVVTNSIPNTGISLPFFSYGGTALAIQLVQVGVLLNVSRYANLPKR